MPVFLSLTLAEFESSLFSSSILLLVSVLSDSIKLVHYEKLNGNRMQHVLRKTRQWNIVGNSFLRHAIRSVLLFYCQHYCILGNFWLLVMFSITALKTTVKNNYVTVTSSSDLNMLNTIYWFISILRLEVKS